MYLLTPYFLTPWSRVLLETLICFQPVKKFPAFYGTWRFITAFTSARNYYVHIINVLYMVYKSQVVKCRQFFVEKLCTLWNGILVYWNYFIWCNSPQWAMAVSFTRFLSHTKWCTIVGRTPLDKWSARRRDLYLTTHNTHSRQMSMPLAGFEPTIWADKWPQTYVLDGAATGTGCSY